MEKVEADLTRSKSLREKQSKEFLWQLDDVKQRYEQQVRLRWGPARSPWAQCLHGENA